MTKPLLAATVAVAFMVAGVGVCQAQSQNEDDVATLYRESVAISGARLHVATFDAEEKTASGSKFDYNWTNCTIAAALFETQAGTIVKYWCEKGFYRN